MKSPVIEYRSYKVVPFLIAALLVLLYMAEESSWGSGTFVGGWPLS